MIAVAHSLLVGRDVLIVLWHSYSYTNTTNPLAQRLPCWRKDYYFFPFYFHFSKNNIFFLNKLLHFQNKLKV